MKKAIEYLLHAHILPSSFLPLLQACVSEEEPEDG